MTWGSYQDAVVRLHLPSGPLLLVPSATPASAPLPCEADGTPLCVVTAHNPRGRRVSDADNARAHRALLTRLDRDGVTHFPAAGGDRDWVHVEESVAIVGLPVPDAVALGRDLAQDAIFVWTPDAFSLVGCETGDVVSSAWTVAPTPPALARVDTAYRALDLPSPYGAIAGAYAALDRALVAADPETARRLNGHYLDLAGDYYHPRDAREAQQEARQRALEAERAAYREARDRAQEAAREAAAARARAARQKAVAQHERDVEAGWPRSWRPKQVSAWTRLGGDAAQAVAFDDHGWDPDDVLVAGAAVVADAGILAALVPPAGPAAHHLSFGDSLEELVTGSWPTAPAGALLSMKRVLPTGRRERWFVVREDDGVAVVPHVCRPAASWTSSAVRRHADSLAAVRDTTALHHVRGDSLTDLAVSPELHDAVLGLLRAPSEGHGDAAALDGDDALEEEAIAEALAGVEHRVVRCTLNGRRLTAVRVGRGWHWVRVDTAEDALLGQEVARSAWFSEAGGAPISWSGGNSLTLVAPGVVEDRQWGDEGAERSLVAWPRAHTARARVVAEWITRLDLQTAAAIELEAWPDEDVWAEWHAVSISLSLDLDDEVRDAVRRRLGASDPAYREARHAVRHPTSRAGRALTSALAEAVLTDFTGDLLRINWMPTPPAE